MSLDPAEPVKPLDPADTAEDAGLLDMTIGVLDPAKIPWAVVWLDAGDGLPGEEGIPLDGDEPALLEGKPTVLDVDETTVSAVVLESCELSADNEDVVVGKEAEGKVVKVLDPTELPCRDV